jgi:hypothetical protein
VARLEAIDVDGLPEDVARQVFGEWARTCARLCRERGIAEPLRYAPDPGRGAVIARTLGQRAVPVALPGAKDVAELAARPGGRALFGAVAQRHADGIAA